MEIPYALLDSISQGQAVLLLGSGASMDASSPDGKSPPNGVGLAEIISDKFLGGQHRNAQLSRVAELAISETSLSDVQLFLKNLFISFKPSTAHEMLPGFAWWGLATTNYDKLIEDTYTSATSSTQQLVPFVDNDDQVERVSRNPSNLPLLKLHGCITRISNSKCPLILTPDQYITHRQGRSRVFDMFKDWCFEHPVIFIGHSLDDIDIRTLLLEITADTMSTRPRYYTVSPGLSDMEKRFWEGKRVSLLDGTFEEFMAALDASLTNAFRGVGAPATNKSEHVTGLLGLRPNMLSQNAIDFLVNDVQFVKAITSTETVSPTDFYRGVNPGWAAIEQDLDIKRNVMDTILADNFLVDASETKGFPQYVLIKAHAGAGKTVLMKRLAWTATHDYELNSLFLNSGAQINVAALKELLACTSERFFLFVDDAGDHVRELEALATGLQDEGQRLIVVIAERINEWNVSAETIEQFVGTEYEIGYLNETEIEALLEKLEIYSALGTLESASSDERKIAFSERAGRQLLVALHEATLGQPFEQIIVDEYEGIAPPEAQQLYLSVCLLNRFNVTVRAGVISRIHDINFILFKKQFFKPLEHVVIARFDKPSRDYGYCTRHPHIADIVYQTVLSNQEKRFDVYIRCLRAMNVSYGADRNAFSHLTKGRAVLEAFPSHELASKIYEAATELAPNNAHLIQQQAIYEMHRPNGSLTKSSELLDEAARIEPHSYILKHSKAELCLKRASSARTELEFQTLVTEAETLGRALCSGRFDTAHPYTTLAKAAMMRCERLLSNEGEASEGGIQETIRRTEEVMRKGLQEHPGDSYLLNADSKFARLLKDSARAKKSLEHAFATNPRSTYIASRLARLHIESNDVENAEKTLKEALGASPSDQELHFLMGKLMVDTGRGSDVEKEYHLKRAFTPGDGKRQAQLLYGRQLYINGKNNDAQKLFRLLKMARVPSDVRNKLQYPLDDTFSGQIERVEATYCFFSINGKGDDWIYAHQSNIEDEVWKQLSYGKKVNFQLAFTFAGRAAYGVTLA